MKNLAERLVKIRGDYTQKQFSEMFGISKTTYANYEQNRFKPDFNFLESVAQKFCISLNWLILGKGPMKLEDTGGGIIAGGNVQSIQNSGHSNILQNNGQIHIQNGGAHHRPDRGAEGMLLLGKILASGNEQFIALALGQLRGIANIIEEGEKKE